MTYLDICRILDHNIGSEALSGKVIAAQKDVKADSRHVLRQSNMINTLFIIIQIITIMNKYNSS